MPYLSYRPYIPFLPYSPYLRYLPYLPYFPHVPYFPDRCAAEAANTRARRAESQADATEEFCSVKLQQAQTRAAENETRLAALASGQQHIAAQMVLLLEVVGNAGPIGCNQKKKWNKKNRNWNKKTKT